MKILLLTTGSISAYLSHKLAVRLKSDGHEVRHYATKNAIDLIDAKGGNLVPTGSANVENVTLYTGHYSPYISTKREILDWRDKAGHPVEHIDLVNWADACAVVPADFNIVGKMANGIADDFVSSILAAWLGSGKTLYIAEAMNTMMYSNPVHLKNVNTLSRIPGVNFISPTVKRLACGDYGIGALADVDAIANIVEGHRWRQPVENGDLIGKREYNGNEDYEQYRVSPLKPRIETFSEYLPRFDEPGSFGAKRKFDRHEGVDVYCRYGSMVYAVEDGVVVDSYQYTGAKAGCDWWNDTWCIKVKGRSGVVTYGELMMPGEKISNIHGEELLEELKPMIVGQKVQAGQFIGRVGRVLKENKLRKDIRHHNTSMLHMELRTESCHIDGWKLDEDRDRKLLDPTPYLHLSR